MSGIGRYIGEKCGSNLNKIKSTHIIGFMYWFFVAKTRDACEKSLLQ